ncbi:MAG: 2-amino-4-hydroxy-6-hydroxymethyldihydropteridine diphosphokinase [Woeseiaceae bacterium]|jgi:2-amino-4-hydroxy-6-hydroxymethyldihydropteridine diphosphokinase
MNDAEHWFPIYIGLGSNLDMPERQVGEALDLLDRVGGIRVVSRSSLYRSAPLGGIEQPDFVNAVAAGLTTLEPADLLAALQDIENERGRKRDGTRWGPRIVDLDLLVYGGRTIDEPGLTVPHPGIATRNFVLLPLGEIAPELVIPGLGRVVSLPVDRHEPEISRIE